jgi:hypothetical protein
VKGDPLTLDNRWAHLGFKGSKPALPCPALPCPALPRTALPCPALPWILAWPALP